MKTTVAIFFLTLLVSIQTPALQLLKIPRLIEHFIKHKNQNGVSFFGFLQEHYVSNHNDSDLQEDKQLPFKSVTFHSISCAIVPAVIKACDCVYLHVEKKQIASVVYVNQQHLFSIFHPPRA